MRRLFLTLMLVSSAYALEQIIEDQAHMHKKEMEDGFKDLYQNKPADNPESFPPVKPWDTQLHSTQPTQYNDQKLKSKLEDDNGLTDDKLPAPDEDRIGTAVNPQPSALLFATQNEANYLVKITNKSKRTFRLFCNNLRWRPVIFLTPKQLVNSKSPDIVKSDEAAADKERAYLQDLYDKQKERYNQLVMDHKTKNDIENDPVMKSYDALIHPLIDKMRPVIQPGQVADDLPCRLYRKSNAPTDKVPHWVLPEAYLDDGDLRIQIIDTDSQKGCEANKEFVTVRIEARTRKSIASTCVNNTGNYGKVHLIINEDDTLKLEPVTYTGFKE